MMGFPWAPVTFVSFVFLQRNAGKDEVVDTSVVLWDRVNRNVTVRGDVVQTLRGNVFLMMAQCVIGL